LNVRRFGSAVVLRALAAEGGPLDVAVAERFGLRLVGLAGLSSIEPGFALLLPECRSVHTFGMRFAIDVVFVRREPGGSDARVLSVVQFVQPMRIVRSHAIGPVSALELAAGEARRRGIAAKSMLCLGPS
jgi:uncharacterized membrane protein (UPF0127 family)